VIWVSALSAFYLDLYLSFLDLRRLRNPRIRLKWLNKSDSKSDKFLDGLEEDELSLLLEVADPIQSDGWVDVRFGG